MAQHDGERDCTEMECESVLQRQQLIANVRAWCKTAKKMEVSPLYLASEKGDLEAVKLLCVRSQDLQGDEGE